MPYVTPPDDYVLQPTDEFRLVVSVGFIQPPMWVIESAMRYNGYELIEGSYQNGDLVIVGRLAPRDPDEIEVIQAGAVPGYVIGILAAAGVGLIGLLIVKDFKIKVGAGGIDFETETSIPGFITVVLIGLGVLWFAKK
jgi:hypothetical protein